MRAEFEINIGNDPIKITIEGTREEINYIMDLLKKQDEVWCTEY